MFLHGGLGYHDVDDPLLCNEWTFIADNYMNLNLDLDMPLQKLDTTECHLFIKDYYLDW